MNTATYPPSNDLMRPKQALDLRQRPASTSMPLVHTEEVSIAQLSSAVRCDLVRLHNAVVVQAELGGELIEGEPVSFCVGKMSSAEPDCVWSIRDSDDLAAE